MSRPIIEVENLAKCYRLGQFNATTLAEQIASIFQRRRNAPTDGQSSNGKNSEHWALNGVSFSVQPGEVVGIIGRNGAGKSTLLKILSRITAPTGGRAILRGRVGSLLEVGVGFHPDLSGRENIFLNGAILGMTKAEIRAKFDEIVAFAEIDKFLDTPVKRYSSGMYVRLAFGVAAHLEPEILIVDEVLAVGDVQFQKKCIGKMSQVAADGRTVLFVSHNMVAVRSLCSRAILLTNGSFSMDGKPSEAIEHYHQDGLNNVGQIEWDNVANAPGDELVRLKSVSVSAAGMESGRVDIQRDFEVAIEYHVLDHCRALNVGLILTNARDEVVVSSGNLKSVSASYDPWVERSYAPGRYRTSCIFPGRLLNDGTYFVTIDINDASAYHSRVHAVDVLKFEIVDTGYMREEYQGPWPGNLRVKLPWSTTSLGAAFIERQAGFYMNVLFTTPYIGFPPVGGPELRIANSLKTLARLVELHVFPRCRTSATTRNFLNVTCKGILDDPSYSAAENIGRSADSHNTRRIANRLAPRVVAGFERRRNTYRVTRRDTELILDYVQRHRIRTVWFGYGCISYPLMRSISLIAPKLRIVCDTDSVWSQFICRELDHPISKVRRKFIITQTQKKVGEEKRWVNFCDVTTAVCDADAEYYRSLANDPSKIKIFRNAIDVKAYEAAVPPPPNHRRPNLVMTGSYYSRESPMVRGGPLDCKGGISPTDATDTWIASLLGGQRFRRVPLALGKRLDILRPLTLDARVIGRPTIMTGTGRHGVLAAPNKQSPPHALLLSPSWWRVNAAF